MSCNFIATVSPIQHDSPDVVEQAFFAAIQRETFENVCLQWRDIVDQTSCDPALIKLLFAMESDFHGDLSNTHLTQPYLLFREGYYVFDGIILYRDRIVVLVSLRGTVLKALHAAHQGVSAMERRARATDFWPGMAQDISNIRNSCVHCNHNAPSQAAIPLMPTNPPTTPFEHIFADYFDCGWRHFLMIGDKFSGWADVFGTSLGSSIAGAAALVRLLRTYFAAFGVPDEISTDAVLNLQLSSRSSFSKLRALNITCHRLISSV